MTSTPRPSASPQQLLLDGAPMLLAYVGRDERYEFVNARYATVFGPDLVGKHVRDVVGDAAYEAIRPNVQQALRGEFTQYRRWVTMPSGERRFYQTIYQPHQQDGVVHGFRVYGFDATEEKRTEEALDESEKRFRAIFDTAAVGITLITPDRRFLILNEHACELLGYSQEELLGRSSQSVAHPDDEEVTLKAMRRLIAGEAKHVQIEKRFLHRDGRLLYTTISSSLIRDHTGAPRYFVVVVTDITARKEAEAALRESERHYRSVFENAAVGMARMSRDGRWLEVNERLGQKLGYTREELLDLTFQDVSHADDHAEDARQVRRLLRGEIDVYEVEKRFLRKDGGLMWGRLTLSGVQEDDGEPSSFVAIIENITDRKRAEDALRELNLTLEQRIEERTADLVQLNREMDAFNYSVSHDLRAPLRGIDGFSQALLEDYAEQLDETGRSYLQRVRSGAQRMGNLIDALLMISRLSRQELRPGQVDLGAIAKEVLEELQEEAPERRVAIEIAPSLMGYGDEDLLRDVMTNLLRNALKFTHGTPQARIEVGGERRENELVVFVRDNGAGFDPRYADKLFVPFQRLHSPEQFEGQGIGLATVQRIIQRHDGRVWATGAVGEGATFFFTLPAVGTSA